MGFEGVRLPGSWTGSEQDLTVSARTTAPHGWRWMAALLAQELRHQVAANAFKQPLLETELELRTHKLTDPLSPGQLERSFPELVLSSSQPRSLALSTVLLRKTLLPEVGVGAFFQSQNLRTEDRLPQCGVAARYSVGLPSCTCPCPCHVIHPCIQQGPVWLVCRTGTARVAFALAFCCNILLIRSSTCP